ncbi:MAG: penicillin-binding protein [Candidatus Dactylopiibacterium carminicum]|uniref:Penicillin-binding protein 1A n=1 Tax=Candidatus Dactylopiibacterium carminicum TaxID=857335 RepID=A0A272EMR9_9RHOO|nr:penicillin-binding protein 1A [Candidatus Dactylopiibacterium carminicum]KAF7597809.1 penicillin-binding protein 1A [Candidatus Dactylopiibacterium carminicum]PAS91409.1 MAG: penicillin-binding protein [Candidatus Dactylopiibacterium carminicum]PAS92534.1 MAG: penicillin-binding protein [Candidatus Dactylopiibacterium carminicum]PAS95602.1 MAG: penicillin-binding protein [Candidatus Dactylopiibacterium carminicum]
MLKRILTIGLISAFGLCIVGAAALAIAASMAWPRLPSLEALTEYTPRIPLRIYTADGELIGEFGEERRTFVSIDKVPAMLKHAILAAEDDRFYEHSGVDVMGLARASLRMLAGGAKQGGSTITMQVARNFYLSREQKISRKFYEILLSLKIEQQLSKDKILEVYINHIFLGNRSYGFAVAAETYYGRPLEQLKLAELAMLAGLPKAPSSFNPVVNPLRATARQQYVLRRMQELGYITTAQYDEALKEPLRLAIGRNAVQRNKPTLHAEFVAEMARQIAYERFKEQTYSSGIRVITTLRKDDQLAAYQSLRRAAIEYERRHGYRGAEGKVDLRGVGSDAEDAKSLEELVDGFPDLDEMRAAIVLESVPGQKLRAYLRGGEVIELTGRALRFPGPMMARNAPAQKRLEPGSVIRVARSGKEWQVVQPPEVEGAFISLDPRTGEIRSLVGGFDFARNKFNHVTQAWRQPGSSFKPFIFSAAMEKGFTPGAVFDDAPLHYTAEQTGGRPWSPGNYDGRYEGPMSLRTALAKSKNVVAIRLLDAITPAYAQDYVVSRFGFDADKNPPYLTLALGAGNVTPWQMASAYSVFANGGYRIQPFVVKEIQDGNGQVIARVEPAVAGTEEAERVLDPRNVFLTDLMMKDVVRRGTAGKAMALKRGDLAGKTGTTNDYLDAWFCGYSPALVGVAWMGFDQPRKLGSGETGGVLALPMWIDYMRVALKDEPEQHLAMPAGLVEVQPTFDKEGPDYIYEEHLPLHDPATEASAPGAEQPHAEPDFWSRFTN